MFHLGTGTVRLLLHQAQSTPGDHGCLGHGNTERLLVPKQMQTLAGLGVLSVATGDYHCLAVTQRGEVFSCGFDLYGQCGHGSHGHDQLLPRRVEALTGVNAHKASAGRIHSLVVTEECTLYSLGEGSNGQLGHSSLDAEYSPKMVDALRDVHVTATAAVGGHSHLRSPRIARFFEGGATLTAS